MSRPDQKGFVLKTHFVIALVVYTISDETSIDVFTFSANKWLFSETPLATILCSQYDLHGKTSITNDELLYALSDRSNKIHMEFFGISRINEPYALLNSCNIFRYGYQLQGRSQWFYFIERGPRHSTWNKSVSFTMITCPSISRDLIEVAGSDTTLSIPSPLDCRRHRRLSRRSALSNSIDNAHAVKRVKVNNNVTTQPISDKNWYSERMKYHKMVVIWKKWNIFFTMMMGHDVLIPVPVPVPGTRDSSSKDKSDSSSLLRYVVYVNESTPQSCDKVQCNTRYKHQAYSS